MYVAFTKRDGDYPPLMPLKMSAANMKRPARAAATREDINQMTRNDVDPSGAEVVSFISSKARKVDACTK